MLTPEQVSEHVLNDKDFAKNVKILKVLKNDTEARQITLLCKLAHDPADPEKKNSAIAILSKTEFRPEQFKSMLEGTQDLPLTSRLYFSNTIYHKQWLDFNPESEISTVQCKLIYPCT